MAVEVRRTHAAYVYGDRWLRIAESFTKPDKTSGVRNVVAIIPELEAIPSTISAGEASEAHARAVAACGAAPTESQLGSMVFASKLAKRLRSIRFAG